MGHKRRGISDMLAALILIVIVIAGFSMLVYPQVQRFLQTSSQFNTKTQQQGVESGVEISLVYATSQQSEGQTQVTLYLDSYGASPFTPLYFIVDLNGQTYTVYAFTITVGGALVHTIEGGQNAEVQFTIPYSGPMPSAYYVSAVRQDGQTLTWLA